MVVENNSNHSAGGEAQQPKDLFSKCETFTRAHDLIAAGLYPYFHRVESPQEPVVTIEGRSMVMAGSNNYLGMANNATVKAASAKAVEKYGIGCVGSRFLNGTHYMHEQLEKRLAKFMGKEEVLVFSTGMQTNLGVISALVGKGDFIVADKLIHASLVDGCKLSGGKVMRFRHNNMADLERILQNVHGKGGILIVVDGVYSMEGDLANLPEIVKLKEKYGARLLVDDAHSTGVLGKTGRGTPEYFGVEDQVDLIMCSFSKSFASIGGFIAASKEVIHFLKHNARSIIFSASLPPAVTASVLAVLDFIEQKPELGKRAADNAEYLRKALHEMGYDVGEPTPAAIIPILLGKSMTAFQMWRLLYEYGVFTTPVVTPAVPEGRAMIRISTMAIHEKEHLDIILKAFKECGEKLGVIGPHHHARHKHHHAHGVNGTNGAAVHVAVK
ncbi:MAG: aminotransferase class I/II-fold pyridoxal phosphate-dependent enzyme [Bacteroidetes bacterium]|nr:aminotransferase class I/II-fold pyridoxal phosphate-dependent enzyme [Bacteroidota bacterium]